MALNADTSLSIYSLDAAGAIVSDTLRIANSGATITTNANYVTSTGRFLSSSAFVVIARDSGASTILLRPNGEGSGTGQVSLDSAGLLTVNGNISCTGTGTAVNWISTSDAELKESIHDAAADPYLADSLRFVSFNWKSTGEADVGVIAQEFPKRYVRDNGGVLGVDKASAALEAVIGLAERVRRLEGAK